MDLQRTGWLAELLHRILGDYDPETSEERLLLRLPPAEGEGGGLPGEGGPGGLSPSKELQRSASAAEESGHRGEGAGAPALWAAVAQPSPGSSELARGEEAGLLRPQGHPSERRILAPSALGPASGRRLRALRYVDQELRSSGLVYGFPRLPPRISRGQRLDRAESLFLAVVASKAFLALDVARLYGRPFDPRRAEAELSMLLAASAGQVEVAERIRGHLLQGDEVEAYLPRLHPNIERALLERIPPVSGELRLDLPVHNGLVFGDARLLGRLAIAHHGADKRWPELARHLLLSVDGERAGLLLALHWLAEAMEIPKKELDAVVAKELRRLRLSRQASRELRDSLERPPTVGELADRIRPPALRRFVLEQAFLATWLTGEELPGLPSLWGAFGCSEEEATAIEEGVAEYFFDIDEVYDAFSLRASAQEASAGLVDRMAKELALNLWRVGQEVKETGELTQLLAKAAMGQKLDAEERAKAKEQLIDLAKVVPSLAILAAPGGTLIFAALLKVLPFNLLPSAFQSPAPGKKAIRRPPRSSGSDPNSN